MTNLKTKLKELEVYEKHLSAHYPTLTQFEVLQISIQLMNCKTKEEVKTVLNYVIK